MLIIFLMLCGLIQACELKLLIGSADLSVTKEISEELNVQIHEPGNLKEGLLVNDIARQNLFQEFAGPITSHEKYQGLDWLNFYVDDNSVHAVFPNLAAYIHSIIGLYGPSVLRHLNMPEERAKEIEKFFEDIAPSLHVRNVELLVLALDSPPFDGLIVHLVIDNENESWQSFVSRKQFGDLVFFSQLFEIFPHIELRVMLVDDEFGIDYDLVRLEEGSYCKTIGELAEKSTKPNELILSEIPGRLDTYAFREGALAFKIPETDKVLLAGVQGPKISDKKTRWRATFDQKLVDAKIVSAEIMKLEVLGPRGGFIAEQLTKITDPHGKEYCLECTIENMEFLRENLGNFAEEGASMYSVLESILQPINLFHSLS